MERSGCEKCGACCTQAGPTLRPADKGLLDEGIIAPASLVTLRKGEVAVDPSTGGLVTLEQELVKVWSGPRGWNCPYLGRDNMCTIYRHRPVECASFRCWDTEEAMEVMRGQKLSRRDLFAGSPKALELMDKYEERLSVPALYSLFAKRPRDISEVIRLDDEFRSKVAALVGGADLLPLLFGRPVTLLLKDYRAALD